MKKGFAYLPLVIIIAAVLASGAVGYFALTTNKEKTSNSSNTNAANVNIGSNANTLVNVNSTTSLNSNVAVNSNSTNDAVRNWKTYTNDTYKYSIRYPETYAKITTPNGDVSVRFDKGKENTADYQFLMITVITSAAEQGTEMQSLYQWGKDGFPFTALITKSHQDPRREKLGKQTFVVTDGDRASSGIPEYLLFKNDLLYYIGSFAGNGTQVPNRELIATMTFPDPTAGWKTYTNGDLGFSFKYLPGYSDVTVIDSESRDKKTLGSDNRIVTSGQISALLSLRASPTTENEYPSVFVQVYPLNGYSYTDPPGGVTYIYRTATHSFWNAEGNEVITDPKLKTLTALGATGFITGRGDAGSLTNSVLFVNERSQRVVEMNFGSHVTLDGNTNSSTRNTEVWKNIAATFGFTK